MSSQSSFPYIITLSSLEDSQLDEWFDHLDQVFEKTPRDYFVNHWMNDPWRDIKGIQLAVATNMHDGSKVIASTVRTFIRKVYWDGEVIPFGGIGEVSTKTTFRNRGLAKVLLHKSMEYMKTKQIAISGLHTGSSAPLYASLGWCSKNRLFVHRSVDSIFSCVIPESFNFKIRPSNLSNQEEFTALVQLQRTYSSHFNGTFVRDEDYWRSWVLKEIGQSSHYVVENTESKVIGFLHTDVKTRKFPETVVLVRDFGVNEDLFGIDRGRAAFFAMAQQALQCYKNAQQVRYPAPLFEEWDNTADIQLDMDSGTMYRVIDSNGEVKGKKVQEIVSSIDPHTHVFWDVDAF